MTMQQFETNPFLAFLEDNQRAAFFGEQERFGGARNAPSQKRFFQGQFQNIQNEFLGKLAQQIRQGQTPNLRFTDFVGGLDFTQRFASLPPSFRGDFPSQFNPPTRSLFF